MRAYAILSNVPDILFFTADDQYKAQLQAKTRQDARPGDDGAMSGDINLDTLQMQFLPIFASAEMMKLVESPVKSITTSDGFTCVIRTYDDHLFIGMGDEDSETFIEGQLILLRDLIGMLYGPVLANLKPSRPILRQQRWLSTASILQTIEEQRKSDQCYLVQAIEIIHVSLSVRQIFASALEAALREANKPAGQGVWGAHAILLVGTKLLALYSHPSVPEINASDLFLIGLYVQDVFKRDMPHLNAPSTLAAVAPQTVAAVSAAANAAVLSPQSNGPLDLDGLSDVAASNVMSPVDASAFFNASDRLGLHSSAAPALPDVDVAAETPSGPRDIGAVMDHESSDLSDSGSHSADSRSFQSSAGDTAGGSMPASWSPHAPPPPPPPPLFAAPAGVAVAATPVPAAGAVLAQAVLLSCV